MKNNFIKEICVSAVLFVLLLFFLNPFEIWMPNAFLMMMIIGLIVTFALFGVFVWQENSKDERENLHKMMAGKFAFLVGVGGIVIAIIVQSLRHNLDGWLIGILSAMIFAKIVGLVYNQRVN